MAWAQDAPAAVLMCHPGLTDSDSTDDIAHARTQEFAALNSERWPQLLQEQGIQLKRHPLDPNQRETQATGHA
jgi:predicted glycoside hydrolase/deacetylase ChbG (UPF0249 family)